MSDRTNRDVGHKKDYTRRYKKSCGCWHCLTGKEKKYILEEKEYRREKKLERM